MRCVTGLATTAALISCFAVPAAADILVPTYNGSNVMRFTESGDLTPTGQIPTGSGGMQAAAGVAIDPSGNIYASSRNTGEVIRYDAGTLEPTTFIPSGTLLAPAGLHFGPADDLYAADSAGGAIRRYDGSTGAFESNVIENLFFAGGFTFAPNGDMYAADFGAGVIYKIDYETAQASLFVNMNDPQGTPAGPNAFLGGRTPSSVLLGSSGDLYVTDLYQNQLLHYDATGNLIGSPVTIDIPGQPIPLGEFPSYSPSDLTFDRSGNILVANLGYSQEVATGTLAIFDPDLNFLSVLADEIPSASALTLTPAPFILGDMNGDRVLNNLDIQPFEKALSGNGKYLQELPLLTNFELRGDINDDGDFNNLDIQPFERLLTSTPEPAAAVPEPAGMALAAMGLLALLGLHRKR